MKSIPTILCMTVLFSTQFAAAATLHMTSSPLSADGVILVRTTLDTEGENINALEGSLVYPKDQLTLREIRDGDSLVNFWIERPEDSGGSVRFSGITPGGYSGTGREVFSMVFDVRDVRDLRFRLSDGLALLNDGNGTAVELRLSQKVAIDETAQAEAQEDLVLPEQFAVFLGSDASVEKGKTFAVFATQDKQSGIDHYEIAEKKGFRRFGMFLESLSFQAAVSPYILEDQGRSSYIYVKAIDKAGNARYAVLSPMNANAHYYAVLAAGILILLGLILYVRKRR